MSPGVRKAARVAPLEVAEERLKWMENNALGDLSREWRTERLAFPDDLENLRGCIRLLQQADAGNATS